jgi:hypothetical protein
MKINDKSAIRNILMSHLVSEKDEDVIAALEDGIDDLS